MNFYYCNISRQTFYCYAREYEASPEIFRSKIPKSQQQQTGVQETPKTETQDIITQQSKKAEISSTDPWEVLFQDHYKFLQESLLKVDYASHMAENIREWKERISILIGKTNIFLETDLQHYDVGIKDFREEIISYLEEMEEVDALINN